ncbi:NUDIX domain-containing protein [Candidatus Shapirobacteria bacterium]|nr:NUDIX domain-containing protein [Candidatus Shapirobacteria bacterium]
MTNNYQYKYCPSCGEVLSKKGDNYYLCLKCDFKFYITVSTSVGAIILNKKNQVLLDKRNHDPGIGKWGIPAGFLEKGETATDALSREICEELGLKVLSFEYFGTYPGLYKFQNIDYPTLHIVYKTIFPENQNIVLSEESRDFAFFDFDKIPLDEIGNEDHRLALVDLCKTK